MVKTSDNQPWYINSTFDTINVERYLYDETGDLEVNDNLIPVTNNTFTLGTAVKRWKSLYYNSLVADINNNIVTIPNVVLGSALTPLVGGVVYNIPFDLSSNPLYNAYGAVNPSKSYIKFPTKGIYIFTTEIDWSLTAVPIPFLNCVGYVVLKEFTIPGLVETEVNKDFFPVMDAGTIDEPPTYSHPNPLSITFIYRCNNTTTVVEAITGFTVGGTCVLGFKNTQIVRLCELP